MSQKQLLSVTIVTYNSGRFIRRCLESVLEQRHPHLEVIVVDNASTDGTTDILEHFENRCVVVYNEENIGFAGAQNQAISMSRGAWVLTLNPDVLLLPDFCTHLMEVADMHPRLGTVCGKLLMMDASSRSQIRGLLIQPVFTSTPCRGIMTEAAWRLTMVTSGTMNMSLVLLLPLPVTVEK